MRSRHIFFLSSKIFYFIKNLFNSFNPSSTTPKDLRMDSIVQPQDNKYKRKIDKKKRIEKI